MTVVELRVVILDYGIESGVTGFSNLVSLSIFIALIVFVRGISLDNILQFLFGGQHIVEALH